MRENTSYVYLTNEDKKKHFVFSDLLNLLFNQDKLTKCNVKVKEKPPYVFILEKSSIYLHTHTNILRRLKKKPLYRTCSLKNLNFIFLNEKPFRYFTTN